MTVQSAACAAPPRIAGAGAQQRGDIGAGRKQTCPSPQRRWRPCIMMGSQPQWTQRCKQEQAGAAGTGLSCGAGEVLAAGHDRPGVGRQRAGSSLALTTPSSAVILHSAGSSPASGSGRVWGGSARELAGFDNSIICTLRAAVWHPAPAGRGAAACGELAGFDSFTICTLRAAVRHPGRRHAGSSPASTTPSYALCTQLSGIRFRPGHRHGLRGAGAQQRGDIGVGRKQTCPSPPRRWRSCVGRQPQWTQRCKQEQPGQRARA
jgi:hypothetical protein